MSACIIQRWNIHWVSSNVLGNNGTVVSNAKGGNRKEEALGHDKASITPNIGVTSRQVTPEGMEGGDIWYTNIESRGERDKGRGDVELLRQ